MPTNFPAHIQDQITCPYDEGGWSVSPSCNEQGLPCEGVYVYV